MNDYIVSVLLGIVEGLTEFLPVSSTAHLRIAEALLHINLADPYWKMYTIVIQLGAILALVFLFLGRILEFFRTFPKGESGDRTVLTHPLSLTMIAFVCTAIPAFLLTKVIGKHLESLRLMATSLLVGGIIMWVVDAWSVRRSRPRGCRAHDDRPGGLDRPLPGHLGRLSRHIAIHVHHRRRVSSPA